MLPKHQLLPGAISEILVSARETGTLTLADRYGLMAAALDETLPEEDQRSVNRLLRSVMQGKIKLSDELSTIHCGSYPPLLPLCGSPHSSLLSST